MTLPYMYVAKKKPNMICDTVARYDQSDIEGKLEDTLNEFNDLSQQWKSEGWEDLEIYFDPWSGEAYIIGYRPLTDAEKARAKRRRDAAKKAAQKRKEKKEAEERAQLEKLKAKYEKGSS